MKSMAPLLVSFVLVAAPASAQQREYPSSFPDGHLDIYDSLQDPVLSEASRELEDLRRGTRTGIGGIAGVRTLPPAQRP